MNPRTLRALLPVLREAREAGVLELEAGEGKNRIRLRMAPALPAGEVPLPEGTDPGAADEEGEGDPRTNLNRHYEEFNAKWGGGAAQ